MTYDFKFYKIEYETDIPVLILSEAKSFIPVWKKFIYNSIYYDWIIMNELD